MSIRLTETRQRELLEALCECEGWNSPIDMLDAHICDSLCPAICTNPDCGFTTNYEHDQTRGWCDECGTKSCVSAMVLANVI